MGASCEIVYWRDIPAQVKVREGRQRVSKQLSARFQQAIDAAAMRSGQRGTDEYLAAWVTRPAADREMSPAQAAESLAADLEGAYSPERLSRLALNGGVEG